MFSQAILLILQPKITLNSVLSMQENPNLETQIERFVSGLAIAHLLRMCIKDDISTFSDDLLSNILAGLSVEFLARQGMDKEMIFDLILREFGNKYLRYDYTNIKVNNFYLCSMNMAKAKTYVKHCSCITLQQE